MIHRERITSDKDDKFTFCWDLYVLSFPEEERRDMNYHIETLTKEQFHFDVILDDSNPIGFIAWWDMPEMRYIEHFAISPCMRGGGYGEKVLNVFALEDIKPILLEVEHPTIDINRRRIAFYQRQGFILNDYEYSHPSYKGKIEERVSLMVMTYPIAISIEQLRDFVSTTHPIVYFKILK